MGKSAERKRLSSSWMRRCAKKKEEEDNTCGTKTVRSWKTFSGWSEDLAIRSQNHSRSDCKVGSGVAERCWYLTEMIINVASEIVSCGRIGRIWRRLWEDTWFLQNIHQQKAVYKSTAVIRD